MALVRGRPQVKGGLATPDDFEAGELRQGVEVVVLSDDGQVVSKGDCRDPRVVHIHPATSVPDVHPEPGPVLGGANIDTENRHRCDLGQSSQSASP
jgi:hypothetical protein